VALRDIVSFSPTSFSNASRSALRRDSSIASVPGFRPFFTALNRTM